jgi:FkbM family methyltransferase
MNGITFKLDQRPREHKVKVKQVVRQLIRRCGFDIIRRKNYPETTLLGLAKQPIRTVIDVGSNIGQFARHISQFFPSARLYCFEPLEEPFRKLSKWAATQNGRVCCYRFAVGEGEGEVRMYRHEDHTPSSSLLSATKHCHDVYPQTVRKSVEKVRLITLDKALEAELDAMPREILLKLDVQGAEDRVLRGAKKILALSLVCFLEVCLDPLYEGQANFLELAELLHECGFAYVGNLNQSYGNNGRVIFLDAVFVRQGI